MNKAMAVAGVVFILAGIGGGLGFALSPFPKPAGYIVGFVFAACFIGGSFLWFKLGKALGSADDLLATGAPGSATIVSFRGGGMTMTAGARRNLLIDLTLDVTPAAAPPYRVEHLRAFWPEIQLGMLRPGTMLAVKIDPANPQRLAIDWSGQATVAPAQLPGLLGQLSSAGMLGQAVANIPKDHQLKAADLLARGTRGRATISQSFATGQTLPDGRALLGFVLSVDLPGQPSYQATIVHAVPADKMARAVVGSSLPVAVDTSDPVHKVAIDWQQA